MGCTKISPACDGCYAEAMMDKRFGKVKWGNHPRERTSAKVWNDPYRWQKQAEKDGTRPFVFCASLADIFDNQVDPQWRAEAFQVMRKTPKLVYLLLTKRPQNIVKLAEAAGGLPANAAIGATVEDQPRANINVPALLEAKRKTKPLFAFLSAEPLLGTIMLDEIITANGDVWSALDCKQSPEECAADPWGSEVIDWVITGGETDQGQHKARPSHPDWFRSLRDQCAAAGVPFHHKQNGEWVPLASNNGEWATDARTLCRLNNEGQRTDDGWPMQKVGKAQSGRAIDGVIHDEFPEVPPCAG
jgi:protein gp37